MRKKKYTETDLHPFANPERFSDLIGKTFGHVTVTGVAGVNDCKAEYLWADCDCGKKRFLFASRSLKSSAHQSCGCHRTSTEKPEHGIWKGMRSRCSNSNCNDYKFYGAKGVRVCERWDNSFEAFYQDVGPRPSPSHSLDRIDCTKQYEPNNVRWASSIEQKNNTSRTVRVEYEGKEWPISMLARHLGLDPQRLYWRYVYCKDIHLAIERMKSFRPRSAPNKEGTGTPERRAWVAIKSRCHDPSNKKWKHYGGRGIYVSEAWRESYEQFLADMGPRPAPGYSLERSSNDGPYSKENCRWATQTEQMNNTRSTTMVEFNGARQPLTPLCRQMGMPIGLVRLRLFKYGWTVERALTEPNHQKSKEDPLSKP